MGFFPIPFGFPHLQRLPNKPKGVLRLKAEIYLRVSTQAQKDKGRLERQEEEIRDYCRSKRWEVADIFYEGVCNKNVKEKPQLEEALNRANKGDKIIAVSLDRFGDNAIAYANYFRARNKGVGLVAIQEDVDSDEDPKDFVEKLYGVDFNKRDKVRKTVTTKGKSLKIEKLRKAGMAGKLKSKYGFRDSNKVVTSDMEYVVQIFLLYFFFHKTALEVAHTLDDDGIPSPTGKKWNDSTILTILKDPDYMEVCVDITEHMFLGIQKRLEMEKGGRGKHMLDNRVYCIKCNQKMSLVSGTYRCRKCNVMRKKKEVEEKVFQEVKQQMDEILPTVFYDEEMILNKIGDIDCTEIYAGEKGTERERAIKNWIPIELDKKVLINNDKVIVIGLNYKEVNDLLNIDLLRGYY
jgi:DNA invertase Pin-like site-specific DNA recombinase